jgi:AraC-like DNA-binding protein
MAASVRRTGCAHFGLLVGQGDILAAHALAGCLIPGLRTVGDALGNIVGHLRAYAGEAAPTLVVVGPVAHLAYVIPGPSNEGTDQVADAAAALAVNVMRTLCGADWSAAEVCLPRLVPTDPAPFTRYYGSPIRFGARSATVAFPAGLLDRPVEAADLLCAVFAAYQAPHTPQARGGFGDDVRRVLRARLTNRDCSATTVAASFSMHRRTFNRHLRAEGSSFNVMVNEVRFEISRRLIADSGMSFGQIASFLCFSEPSAFTRAFRRWSGQSPTAWRADHPAP